MANSVEKFYANGLASRKTWLILIVLVILNWIGIVLFNPLFDSYMNSLTQYWNMAITGLILFSVLYILLVFVLGLVLALVPGIPLPFTKRILPSMVIVLYVVLAVFAANWLLAIIVEGTSIHLAS